MALVNAKNGTHSTLTLDGFDFDLTGWDVKNHTVTDNHGGVWKAKRSTRGPQHSELRLILRTITPPVRLVPVKGKKPVRTVPDGGELTITLSKSGQTDQPVDPKPVVDYADDTPN